MKKISVIGVLALVFLWIRAAELFLTQSSIFELKTIEIYGNEDLSKDEVLTYSGLRMNKNIFKFDLRNISRKIETDRRVKEVILERVIPGKIHIRVEEKKPDLLLNSKNIAKLYGITLEGEVIPMKDNYCYDLPLISGVGTRELSPYSKVDDMEIQTALSFYRMVNEENPAFIEKISEISFENGNNLVIIMIKSSAKLLFGTGNFREKFKLFIQLNKGLRLENYSSLDLRFNDQMIFKGIEKSL